MTAEEFSAWLARMKQLHDWSGRECARRLGCSQNSIAAWSVNGAPLYISLACAQLEMRANPQVAA